MTTATRNRRPSSPRNRLSGPAPLVIAAVVAMAVAALLAVAIAIAGGNDDTASATTFDTGVAATEGAALAVGQQAPILEGVDRDGDHLTLPTAGKPTLLLFIAHWCPHCQREVPQMQEWIDAGRLPEDVEVVAVATAIDRDRPNYPTSAWLDREGWTPPTIADADGSAAEAYGVDAFPFFVAIDADGTVVDRRSGELSLDEVTAMMTAAAA